MARDSSAMSAKNGTQMPRFAPPPCPPAYSLRRGLRSRGAASRVNMHAFWYC